MLIIIEFIEFNDMFDGLSSLWFMDHWAPGGPITPGIPRNPGTPGPLPAGCIEHMDRVGGVENIELIELVPRPCIHGPLGPRTPGPLDTGSNERVERIERIAHVGMNNVSQVPN